MPPQARRPKPAPSSSEESDTPIHDQLAKDLESADPEDVTQFAEDDDPLSNVGELVDEEDEDTSKENS